jgi:branched-chain amino acid transport system ATP-binding protein
MLTIARGLMARPRLLLLDEPSLGLAPLVIADIFRVLREINADKGTTLLVVEQNVHVALQNADYAYVLQLGRVTVEGTARELQENREVVASYLGTQAHATAG